MPAPVQSHVFRALQATAAHLTRGLAVTVEGLSSYPAVGPVVVAAQHYHHLYDGCLLLRFAPRPLHLVVALDWAAGRWYCPALQAACRLAGWPVVLRPTVSGATFRNVAMKRTQNRRGLADALALLAAGGDLGVFPEGYPLVDPNPTPKSEERPHLPLQPGFARLAMAAAGQLGRPVPVVPVTFSYTSDLHRVAVRYHTPLEAQPDGSPAALVRALTPYLDTTSGQQGA